MRTRGIAPRSALCVGLLVLSLLPGIAPAATILHYTFNETGNAPSSDGTNATPVRMRNDGGTVLDFHSAANGGVTGLPGDRSFANTGANVMGSLASGATNGFRADQPDLDAIDALTAFTVSGWFRTENATLPNLQGATPRLVSNHDAGAGAAGDGFNLQFLTDTEGDLKLDVDDDSVFADSSGTGARYSAKQTWVFFAVSYDGALTTNNVNFYIGFRNDGEAGGGPGSANVALVKTTTLNRGPVDAETVGLALGNRNAGDRPFDGFLDEIRIDNVAHTGGTGLAALDAYRQAALVAPRNIELRLVSTSSVSTAVLDQNGASVVVPELSGITYDPVINHFWSIGDSGGRMLDTDVLFNSTTGAITSAVGHSAVTLANSLDFEGIAFTNSARNSVFICQENDPGVREYSLASGALLQTLAVPAVFTANARDNRSFESLSRNTAGTEMITAVEQALTVDGPDGTSTTDRTVSRVLRYSVSGNTATPAEQYAYVVEPQHVTGTGDGSSLSEITILAGGGLLTLERSIAADETLVRAYFTSRVGATDVSQGALGAGLDGQTYTPLKKTRLFSDLSLGKFEGWTVGPALSGGGFVLLGVEDDSSSTATLRSFALTGDTSVDPCAALGGDADADGICQDVDNCDAVANPAQTNSDADTRGDACDNCPLVSNEAQADGDADGDGDVCDNCPTVANADQADGGNGIPNGTLPGNETVPFDGVGNACDNCVNVNNPIVPGGATAYLAANPWATLTGGQRDDDHDGYGNTCDGDFGNNNSTTIADTNQYKASLGETKQLDTCGTAQNRPCAIFDINAANATENSNLGANVADTNRYKLLLGNVPGPRCPTCPLTCLAGTAGSCSP